MLLDIWEERRLVNMQDLRIKILFFMKHCLHPIDIFVIISISKRLSNETSQKIKVDQNFHFNSF